MKFSLYAFIVLLFSCSTTSSSSSPASPSRPHIIFILFDDQGYNEVNWVNQNAGRYITPTLDLLADEGISLERNYYMGPLCSPSRAMLMTGRYATRLGVQANVVHYDLPWAIGKEEEFLPQVLGEHGGYTSYGAGKWHIGMMSEWALPTSRGFHMWDGYLTGCQGRWTHVASCCSANSSYSDQDYVCLNSRPSEEGDDEKDYRGYDWFKNANPDLSANGTETTDIMVSSTIQFLRDHASQFDNIEDISPVFLYLSFPNIHDPYTTKEKFYNMYRDRNDLNEDEKVMYAYLTEGDIAVGAIKDELIELGLFR